MKILNYLLAFGVVVLSFACEKGEVPDSNLRYIGSWKNINQTEGTYIIIIRSDGTAEYHEASKSKTKDITGYVYFNGPDFKIGTKNFGSEKFKTNQLPQRVTVSSIPYKYYYTATFNKTEFRKDSI